MGNGILNKIGLGELKNSKAQAVAGLAVLQSPKVRLPPIKEAVNMNSESKPLKPFAQSEREEYGEYLKECVNEGDEIYESSSYYVDELRLVGYPDDQHAPLFINPKGTWLRKQCPHQLRAVTSIAKARCTDHLKIIEEVRTADAQYALLMHYHKVLGANRGNEKKGANDP